MVLLTLVARRVAFGNLEVSAELHVQRSSSQGTQGTGELVHPEISSPLLLLSALLLLLLLGPRLDAGRLRARALGPALPPPAPLRARPLLAAALAGRCERLPAGVDGLPRANCGQDGAAKPRVAMCDHAGHSDPTAPTSLPG